MYNLRYHIASLVAIFLALAIGLLLGTIVVERGTLDKQRTTLVQGLQSDYASLKKENTDLRHERDREHAFAEDAAPVLTASMLEGRTIVIVTNAGRNDGLTAARGAVEAAGGRVVVVTMKSKDLGRGDTRVRDALSGVATSAPGASNDPVVTALANEWAKRGTPQAVTGQLKQSGEMSVEGTSTDIAPDGVILLASFDSASDPALVSLVSALQVQGVRSVGVEPEGVATGVVDGALSAGISTVDDVDRPEGALSLVYVLAGKAEGHFGVKASATSLYPKLR